MMPSRCSGLQLAPIRHLIHHAVLGHAHHFQDIVHGAAPAPHPHPAPGRGNGQDLQIDLGTEAAVEAEFFLEIVVAAAQGGEVQKPQVHRFFDLVGEVIGDKDPGDVRLD